jgi:hypothetical protein
MAISKKRRLFIFFSSFGVTALLMISIFWKGEWLPSNQVKRNLLDNPTQPIQSTEGAAEDLKGLGLNISDIRHFIRNGEVDLPPLERATDENPCVKYLIEYEDPQTEDEYEIIAKVCKEYRKTSRDGQMGTAVLEPVFLVSVKKETDSSED